MSTAFLLTGGNLGDRLTNLEQAKTLISQGCGEIIKTSSVYKTAAWGFTDQPDFYNQALQIETNFQPEQLMQKLLLTEEKMGRKRTVKMGPRIIDIDILLMDDLVLNLSSLSIPHPRLAERRFALTPLVEIAPSQIHPLLKKTIAELLSQCKDNLPVYKISAEK